jgi:hypothetical protein
MNLYLITKQADRRAIGGVVPIAPEEMKHVPSGAHVLVEPVFYDFGSAGDNELGFAFLAANQLSKVADTLSIAITYTQANANKYKGYLQDLKAVMVGSYKHVKVHHVPYVSCGSPLGGSVVVVMGSKEPVDFKGVLSPCLPSEYFKDLLAHVPLNRPNYKLLTSSRGIGAVRSDKNLLPPVSQWRGKSLMVEYKTETTTKITRMVNEDIGLLFGVLPCQYTDDLALVLPKEVISHLLNLQSIAK